jgi:lysophospholipase L1-like esterase
MPGTNRKFLAGLVGIILTVSCAYSQAPESPGQAKAIKRQLNMLVLGDSIVWGQGLKTEHKTWYQLKTWLELNTGRVVVERIEAHSGAVIESGSADDSRVAKNPEVNLALPTINEEVDNALKFYSDPSTVDLVLISACGNDVGAGNLLNASGSEEVDRITQAKCGPPMERLLHKIATSFPAAQVIVVGYYPFFSEKTRNDFVMKALARRFYKTAPGAPRIGRKEVLEQLTANSRTWYQSSNKTLAEVARKTSAELGAGRERIVFVKIEFPSDYSFAAKGTRLWGFNRSPFRMMLVFLSFGKIPLPPNDEVRSQRRASCDDVFKRQPNETSEQKKDRQRRHLLCRYASLGHPNRKGAILYADAITEALKTTLGINGLSRMGQR